MIVSVLTRLRLSKNSIKTCLTCSVNEERCQYNSALLSHNASFYLLSCRGQFLTFLLHFSSHNTSELSTVLICLPFYTTGPGIPYYSLVNNIDNESEPDLVLENNDRFSNLIAGIEMPTVIRDTFDLHGYSK